ncbi:MAG: ISL3 family transposase [Hydrogenophilales bacterium CG03_land_8_20_14_0_80_62_28]|nr:ISL3 family transposase [Betaproteobacteria bacterium]OIO78236.1 MAG: ISL3 family transposase [Hydrogenophilaceae bacterium CG1_02_62_390]PIV23994.1 MAG: ISL3 family transposase [Hydrogenophilales bacterium CG03_land_8_20_14_0_80_62_28]PIW38646.1 MAG: ISL3 family transposase [Hydrogenophilales bacterium CG15_BIG_FIL_POST_REV_8_21_14_020_62_31]PIW71938.1 MAG: ISL3 family transposase [Hydrogenophilales bacterium CG12_big_fil_rev_8_21_14_0_65_61_21]PIX01421.1 MAG: ISL3 family transposase [Hydr
MTAKLFEAALGITPPWYINGVEFDVAKKTLSIAVDFIAGSRFAVPGVEGSHPAHDTVPKRYRHLNFFQHECHLEVRVPRVRVPDGGIRQVEPDWAGRLAGFTLLFEALIMAMCREMTFAAVSRLVGLSWHQVVAICKRYVELGLEQADFSEVKRLAADETSKARGHDYITLVADADLRRVLFVTEGRDADTIKAFAADFTAHGSDPKAVESISIDMSPAFIKGVTKHLPNARITFDKFHVIAHASTAVDKTRRIEQKTDPSLKGLRWKLLRDRASLLPAARADLDALVTQVTTKRTARAWLYKEQLREILERKQINVVRDMLTQWATNVMRSKVEPMKEVAKMIRSHLDGIIAWTQTRQTNGFLEAINGLFQAAKRKARGYGRFSTMRTVVFLLAGKLDFSKINPHAA